jgi:quercetin dioxygenase-like cupin family protein
MNLKDLHPTDKGVAATTVFKTDHSSAVAIQLLKGKQLKEHITKTPAFILCVNGSIIFENENGLRRTLISGDYILIEPYVRHWLDGLEDSQLILVK